MPVTSKVVERKPLTLAEKTYLPQIASGLGITFKNFLRKKVTMEYPDVKPPIPGVLSWTTCACEGPEWTRKVCFLPALRVCLPTQSDHHYSRFNSGRQ